MKKTVIYLLSLLFIVNLSGKEKLNSNDFLSMLRNGYKRNNGNTYAILDGQIEHVRRNTDEVMEYPISMGVIITPDKSMTQIVVDNNEGYMVGQSDTTSILPLHNPLEIPQSKLEKMGLNPADLAMSFVNYDLVNELPSTTIKFVDSRVFVLKNPANDELVKIYVASDYFFTLKAEFFVNTQDMEQNKLNRTLEISSFKKLNGLYYVEKLDLYGPGWRTIVKFDQAQVDFYDANKDVKVFKQIKR